MAVRVKAVWRRVVDVFFGLLLTLSALMSVLVFSSTGLSGRPLIGIVQSRSMEASGICLGDAVLIVPNGEYQKGDVIVFYRAPAEYGVPVDKDAMKKKQIWVHEVIDRKVDGLGRLCYLTKGSSNPKDDSFYVPEDYVLGHGRLLPSAVGSFLRFLATKAGIILFVIMPSAVMFILLLWDLIMLLLTPPEPDPETRVHAFPPPPRNPFTHVPRDKRPPLGAEYMPKARPLPLAEDKPSEKRPYAVATATGGEHLLVYLSRPVPEGDLFAKPLLSPEQYHTVCRVSLQGQRATVTNAVFEKTGTSPMACLDWTRSLRKRTLPERLATPHDAAMAGRSIASLFYDLAKTAPILAVVELGNLSYPLRRELSSRLPRILAEGAERSTVLEASAYAVTPGELTRLAEAALLGKN